MGGLQGFGGGGWPAAHSLCPRLGLPRGSWLEGSPSTSVCLAGLDRMASCLTLGTSGPERMGPVALLWNQGPGHGLPSHMMLSSGWGVSDTPYHEKQPLVSTNPSALRDTEPSPFLPTGPLPTARPEDTPSVSWAPHQTL